jgi:hypothetical protein
MPPNVATGKPQKLLPIADFRLPICDCDCQLPLADCYSGELRAETIGNWQSAIGNLRRRFAFKFSVDYDARCSGYIYCSPLESRQVSRLTIFGPQR